MASITFDTLKFANRLKEAGIPPLQAEAFSHAFKDASGELDVATKADLNILRAELKAEIANFRSEVIKWMVGLSLAQIGMLISILVKIL